MTWILFGFSIGFKEHDDDRDPAVESGVVDGRKVKAEAAERSANAIGDLPDFAQEEVVAGEDLDLPTFIRKDISLDL